MSKIIIFFLFIFNLAFSQNIELIAKIDYTNNSDKEITNIIHKLTIPENRYYQIVKEISISPNESYEIKKRKSLDTEYVELSFGDLKSGETKTKYVHFFIEMKNLNINFYNDIFPTNNFNNEFLSETNTLQINSKPISAISNLINNSKLSINEKIELAYKFPGNYLNYEKQEKTSALEALQTGIGDCTEYAMIFVSLARNLGIEARRVSVFNFAKRKEFDVPNHHIAEIYTKKYGWVPVYPNLSNAGKNKEYELGKISNTILLYNYKAWTWSRSYNKKNKDLDKKLQTKINWEIKD